MIRQANVPTGVSRPLRIFFAAPAYWPATAFGGPVPVMRALARELTALGHRVDVLTTTLTELRARPARVTRTAEVDGAAVHYLGDAARFRWFGITPSLRRELDALPRPDVVHVFGFRDYREHRDRQLVPCDTAFRTSSRRSGCSARSCARCALKRGLDATLYRAVPSGARSRSRRPRSSGASSRRRAGDADRRPAERLSRRPTTRRPAGAAARAGSGSTPRRRSCSRSAASHAAKASSSSSRPSAALEGVQLAIVGPDDGHGLTSELLTLRDRLGATGRVHLLGTVDSPLELYGDADVFALASAHENFGMVAAEAAAAGTPSVVTDRCGVAELLRDRGALVVPYGEAELRDALDAPPRRRPAAGAARPGRPRGGSRALLGQRRPASGKRSTTGRVTDLAVVTQDPRFGGGALAQTQAFVRASTRARPRAGLLHPRFVPLVDSAAQLVRNRAGWRQRVRHARNAWVVAAAAPYGYGALRSGRPYAAWIGTSLDEEWAARRPHLRPLAAARAAS